MKRLLIFISIIALTLTLTFALSGCSGGDDDFEGKNIVTFMVNGGILNYGTSSTKTSVNFAYHPGTYILDPSEDIPNYSLSRSGYNFTGWYTDEACTPSSKWDFSKPFNVPNLTLYAGWEKAVKFTYSVYYVDETNGNEVKLGNYVAIDGDRFSDWKDFAGQRAGYTCIGYYSDKELTTPWDVAFTHPGGQTDLDIPVYAKYIEGEWELVENFEELKHAVAVGNVYLTADIDCGGKEFSIGNFSGIFNGNGYKISNFKVNKSGAASTPSSSIFRRLMSTAEIVNVTFENVSFNFTEIRESTESITVTPKVAALALDMQAGAKVNNVAVTGTLVTNYTGELSTINSVYYYDVTPDEAIMSGVDNFSANITVVKQ